MKSLDVRIISSEVSSIILALEKCQDDNVPEVCAAAVKAAETAKILGRQEEYGDQRKVSPFAKSSDRKASNSPIDDMDIRDSGSSGPSCELQSIQPFPGFDSQDTA
jgi:hypothetical protein